MAGDCTHATANAGGADFEPTTKTLVGRGFGPALRKRFRALKRAVRTAVGRGFETPELDLTANAPDDVEPPAQPFDFDVDPSRARRRFGDWLDEQLERGVLEATEVDVVENGEHYTARYVRRAYERGLIDADRRLDAAGFSSSGVAVEAATNLPVHDDALRAIYNRTYDGLEGITEDTGDAIRRELTRGVASGEGPRTIARQVADEVDDVGRVRATVLARTEVANAYTEATTNRYERMGVREVELLTFDPCTVCESVAADNPYPIDAMPVRPPVHPNCRCTLAPVS